LPKTSELGQKNEVIPQSF